MLQKKNGTPKIFNQLHSCWVLENMVTRDIIKQKAKVKMLQPLGIVSDFWWLPFCQVHLLTPQIPFPDKTRRKETSQEVKRGIAFYKRFYGHKKKKEIYKFKLQRTLYL